MKMYKALPIFILIFVLIFTGCAPKDRDESECQKCVGYPVEFYYSNWDGRTQREESVFFMNGEGTIYGGAVIPGIGISKNELRFKEGELISHVLQKSIEVPKYNDGEKLVVYIDYEAKTMDYEIVPVDKVIMEAPEAYPMDIYISPWDKQIAAVENVYFVNKDGRKHNGFVIEEAKKYKASLYFKEGKIVSEYLGQEIDIPKFEKGQKIELYINYTKGTMEMKVFDAEG